LLRCASKVRVAREVFIHPGFFSAVSVEIIRFIVMYVKKLNQVKLLKYVLRRRISPLVRYASNKLQVAREVFPFLSISAVPAGDNSFYCNVRQKTKSGKAP
jgi:hypothetical protein